MALQSRYSLVWLRILIISGEKSPIRFDNIFKTFVGPQNPSLKTKVIVIRIRFIGASMYTHTRNLSPVFHCFHRAPIVIEINIQLKKEKSWTNIKNKQRTFMDIQFMYTVVQQLILITNYVKLLPENPLRWRFSHISVAFWQQLTNSSHRVSFWWVSGAFDCVLWYPAEFSPVIIKTVWHHWKLY